jgi:plasmid stability protein
MAALLIKNLPPGIHSKLRSRAERNHRSMNREVISILESTLQTQTGADLPPPVRTKRPIAPATIVDILRAGREGRA